MATQQRIVYLFDPERGKRVAIPVRRRRPTEPVPLSDVDRREWELMKTVPMA